MEMVNDMRNRIGYFQAYGSFWRYYADFGNRTTKEAFWKAWFVHNLIIAGLSMPVYFVIDLLLHPAAAAIPALFWVWVISLFAYSIATLIPTIALILRRLHDIDRHGCWVLLFLLVPIVGTIIMYIMLSRPSAPFDVFPGRSGSGPYTGANFGPGNDPYGRQQPPVGWQHYPYGQQPPPYGWQQYPYGQQPPPYEWQQYPYGQQPPPYGWQQQQPYYAPLPFYAPPPPRRFSPPAGGDRAAVAIILTIALLAVTYIFSFANQYRIQAEFKDYFEDLSHGFTPYGFGDPYGGYEPWNDIFGGDDWGYEDEWGDWDGGGNGDIYSYDMSPDELAAIEHVKNSTMPGFPEFTIEEVLLSKVDEWGLNWNCYKEGSDSPSMFYVDTIGTLDGSFLDVYAGFDVYADLSIQLYNLDDGVRDEYFDDALAFYKEWYDQMLPESLNDFAA